jgi:hypothetical protein
MGIGPQALALMHHLARAGELATVDRVIELGGQTLALDGYETLLASCIEATGHKAPDEGRLRALNHGPARAMYEAMGIEYHSIDTDGRYGATVLDLNFDSVPPDLRGRYPLVTNHGTTEHVWDQTNAFRVIHDLAAVDGLMLHVVPFQGRDFIDHCFYCYQPDLFYSLARANGYRLMGMWAAPNPVSSALVPWAGDVAATFSFPPATWTAAVVLLRKLYDRPFNVPYQTKYERSNAADNAARYSYIVDGETVNGAAVQRIAVNARHARYDLKDIPFGRLIGEVKRRVRRRLGGR